jgi:hypothetical protein
MAKEILGKVKLRNVRLSFADLYQPKEGKIDDATGIKGADRYGCSFLIPKVTKDPIQLDNIAQIKRACSEIKEAKWGKNQPKLKADKVCFRDGDEEDYDGYEGMFYLSSGNIEKPVLKDRVKDPKTGKWLDSPVGQLYSGCYVNATVHIWAQDNKHGKRLNASLELVQFLRPGDAFGKRQVNADEEFDDDDVSGFVEESAADDEDDLI